MRSKFLSILMIAAIIVEAGAVIALITKHIDATLFMLLSGAMTLSVALFLLERNKSRS